MGMLADVTLPGYMLHKPCLPHLSYMICILVSVAVLGEAVVFVLAMASNLLGPAGSEFQGYCCQFFKLHDNVLQHSGYAEVEAG